VNDHWLVIHQGDIEPPLIGQGGVVAEVTELGRRSLGHYASFKLDDGVSFVHIASHEGSGNSPFNALAAFRAFTTTIKERCEAPPVAVEWKAVGSYGFSGG